MNKAPASQALIGLFDIPLGAIADATLEGIFVLDRQSKILAANAAALDAFGYLQAELIGRPLDMLIPERLRNLHAAQVRQFSASGADHLPARRGTPLLGVRKDGTEFPIDVAVSRVGLPIGGDGGGSGDCYVAIMCDLTAVHPAAGQLAVASKRFRDLLELTPVAMWITEGEYVRFANRAAHHLFGLPSEEPLAGRSVFSLVSQAEHDLLRRQLERAQDSDPQAQVVQGHIVRADGERREVEIATVALPDHGHTVMQMVITDITRRQSQLREFVQHRSELRRLSANVVDAREEERRRIARELHDELGQRLTALKMELSSLREDGVRRGQADRVDHMLGMIDDTVAAVRRISADLRPLMLDDLGLNAAIESLARHAASHMHIEVTVRLDEEDPPTSDAARIALYRIVQEALTNVARHARASEVRIQLTCDGQEIVLTVQDNGVGFPKGADGATGRYGLLGIRERAIMLGGHMEIDNPQGGGGRITVRLPLVPPPPESAS